MRYYEVYIADSQYRANTPLTYSSEEPLSPMSVVTVELKKRWVTGFVVAEVDKPQFATKPVKTRLSDKPLPTHCLDLARWLSEYYASSLGEALRQFAPTKPTVRKGTQSDIEYVPELLPTRLELDHPLTQDQIQAIEKIKNSSSTTVLLHGDTGTGKTRVYLELANRTIEQGRSVLILTPEISLTTQLESAVKQRLDAPVFVFHSQLKPSERKQIWLEILESSQPIVIVGPRSALFTPVHNPGLIVLDEAHEPAFKQDQSPRYHAARVASQIGWLISAKVVLGTATPLITDYYLANEHEAVVRMTKLAVNLKPSSVITTVVDLTDRTKFTNNPYLSNELINEIKTTLSQGQQAMIYLNRRGTARLILCRNCGWQMLCPNCDIPLVYHGDDHTARCHICGFSDQPPANCPNCGNPDVVYRSAGTKALADSITRLFPNKKIQRFDSDNVAGERLNEIYSQVKKGEIDILVGTQLLAKGLDLPNLGLVGIVNAETSLSLPDYTAEERSFQLLYQVIGRVGRGHGHGRVVIQTFHPESPLIKSVVQRDWLSFYEAALKERQQFRFPPFSYLLKLVCRRATLNGAVNAAEKLKEQLISRGFKVEVVGPASSFYARRGKHHYWQLVVKSKKRDQLVELARSVPTDWMIDLDPADLL